MSTTYANGSVPASDLAPLDGQPDTQLRADAAAAWNRARAAVQARAGVTLRVRGWNRTLAEQERFFFERYEPRKTGGTDVRWYKGVRYARVRGAAAAIPGTSNHGWGVAIDVEDYGTVGQFDYPRRVATFPILAEHGWTDTEGRGAIREPWHLVYDPARDQHKNTPTPKPAPAPVPVPDVQEDDMRGLIEALYRRFLGRDGSTQEIDTWTVDVAAASKTPADVVGIFDAARAETGTVTAAYREFLGRAPGESEIAAWLKTSPTVAAVRAGIAGSAEAKARR